MNYKTILNHGAAVILNIPAGEVKIEGHSQLTRVLEDDFDELMKIDDFKMWIEKGFIIVNANVHKAGEIAEGRKEDVIKQQEEDAAAIKLQALTDAIMANENVTDRGVAEAEARRRLAEEADKADLAGDDDAEELKKASKAKSRKEK